MAQRPTNVDRPDWDWVTYYEEYLEAIESLERDLRRLRFLLRLSPSGVPFSSESRKWVEFGESLLMYGRHYARRFLSLPQEVHAACVQRVAPVAWAGLDDAPREWVLRWLRWCRKDTDSSP